MNDSLFDYTNVSAYFIWETTKHDNALDVWYCAEDIGSYLEKNNLLTEDEIKKILTTDIRGSLYIEFVRNIAFRIYVYTKRTDSRSNWYDTERLLQNGEFVSALVGIANCFNKSKSEFDFIKNVRSESVRNYYYPFTQG